MAAKLVEFEGVCLSGMRVASVRHLLRQIAAFRQALMPQGSDFEALYLSGFAGAQRVWLVAYASLQLSVCLVYFVCAPVQAGRKTLELRPCQA